MKRRCGFTLIELLVVIAIIALLLAILIPTLGRIKQQAACSTCLSNQHQLLLAWVLYAQDNDDKLVGAHDGYAFSPSKDYDWVQLPRTAGGTVVARAMATLEDEIRGCERGTLFPYVRNIALYHCPADRRRRTQMTHRSYGIAGGMNGDCGPEANTWLTQQWGCPSYKKLTEIRSPDLKYVFLEEKTDVGGLNWGSWCLGKQGPHWWDPLLVHHGRVSVLTFCDGHGLQHQWQQESTLAVSEVPFPQCMLWPAPDGTDDLEFMRQGFHPAR